MPLNPLGQDFNIDKNRTQGIINFKERGYFNLI